MRSLSCDFAEPWQLGFQDPATPVMEGMIDLFHKSSFYLTLVLILVGWMLLANVIHFSHQKLTHKYAHHNSTLEIIWTLVPAVVLMAMAIPSMRLLYFADEVIDPALTIKAIGRQWYWSYEYSDYAKGDEETLSFDSYMLPEDLLEEGQLRLLEVDRRVVVPIHTPIRLITTASDVIHSWAVPSLGIKLDGVPGRLNQTSFLIKRAGLYFGQCSELCGTNHAKMPIVVEAMEIDEYIHWILSQLI